MGKLFFIAVILSHNLVIPRSMTKDLSPSKAVKLISIVEMCLDGRNYILCFLQFSREYTTIVIYSQRKSLLWPEANRENFETIFFSPANKNWLCKLITQVDLGAHVSLNETTGNVLGITTVN